MFPDWLIGALLLYVLLVLLAFALCLVYLISKK